ncbi:MAG: hypothetical protein DI571_04485 [Arsenicicoccus sp.]|nr:MAG: hypothetical protein DI571_04485 [Arsenicicoccus sp.]
MGEHDNEREHDESTEHADSTERTDLDAHTGSGEHTDNGEDSDREAQDAPGDSREESEEETRRRQEEFAREHDPADHDVAAGEEFRQEGDWVADDGAEPQQLETDQSMLAATGSATGAADGAAEGDDEEIRDGGHGWGSAAPRSDGGTPEGHPVKAWRDTMTYVLPDEEGYDAAPHECFVDADAAEGAGFRHAHG